MLSKEMREILVKAFIFIGKYEYRFLPPSGMPASAVIPVNSVQS